ncbi:prenylated RAB acceptor 1.F4 [Actinidia rufa]|uniref:Prenylated RAB acceptor 1.F4 n=1 Tax=Actinidia rufa TaxID=165716 RepID=A0A7J0FZX8_9ERIC|nr:prenylated RAB acceptor 1.F4 [Actinidia rufa]
MAHQQPYEPYYLHQPVEYGFSDRNGINTLFVSGLPDDVKAREIHNLFRRRPGFDSCQLKYTGRGNQGVKFDPQTSSVLHIELARSNSRRKRKPGSGAYVVIDKRTKAADDTQENSSDDEALPCELDFMTHKHKPFARSGESESDELSGGNKPDSGGNADLIIPQSGETVGDSEHAVATENEHTEKTVDGVSPCSTLFIANLGPNCTEDEMKQVLSQYPGFKALKVRARGGMPVAFADFEEIEQATKAMEALQGSWLQSSDRGGMHIEYARSKMRKS